MKELKSSSETVVSHDLKTTDYIITGNLTNRENLLKYWGAEFIKDNWMLLNSNESAPDYLGIQSLGFSLTATKEKYIKQSLTCPECEGDEYHCTNLGCQQEDNEVAKQYVIDGSGTYKIRKELDAHKCRWDDEKKAWITQPLLTSETRFLQLKSLATAVDAEIYPLHLEGQQKAIRDILSRRRK
jgi:hypothetical protein